MPHSLIPGVLALCDLASAAILEVYHSNDFGAQLKGDNSPVTKADIEASRILVKGLEALSGDPVVSEEALVPYEKRRTFERFWLVDPLDGTKDFLERDDEFTVNVALIENGIPVLGAVASPALGSVYYAAKGEGAFRRDSSGTTPIRYAKSRASLICADSRFHSSEKIKEFCSANGISEILRSGSAIKMCKLAEGSVDVYPRFGPTMEWDVAASDILATEAGCVVVDLIDRKPLRYNKEDMRNPGFIAYPLGLSLVW
jgi:3'(2'), 5'-bisphosphate nucleotidase